MIAQRLAIAAIVATWSVPTIVVAQHAKAESATHATAPTKGAEGEHVSPAAKKEVGAKPLPEKSSAKEESKEPSPAKDSARSDKASSPAHASAERASSEKEAEPAASSGKKVAGTASARGKTEPKNELAAALKRVDEQLATMRANPSAAQASKPRAASETRAARVSPAPSVARIQLSWRTALVWAPELGDETDAPRDAPHVALVWPATEPLASTPITSGSVH